MEYKKILEDNYTLHLINTNRFKTINVVLFFTKKFNKNDISYGSLLTQNLVYSSKKYNTKNKIAIIGEELYGAKVSSAFGITGSCETFTFSLDFLNPKYTSKEYMNESLNFLYEIIFNPNINENGFNKKYFDIIKKDTITKIKSVKDNPNLYAGIQYARIMYKNTPASYGLTPSLEDINDIDEIKLYNFYKNLIYSGEYKIDICVMGEITEDISKLIKDKFKKLNSNKEKYNLNVKIKYSDSEIEKIDSLKYNQSKLYMGYRLIDLDFHEMNHILKVYNTILGTMNDSLLFNVVREANSLCYSIGSYTSKYNSSLTIYAGINKSNYEKAVSLIKECVNMMSDKKTVERLINYAKKTINTYLNNYYDDVTSQINNYWFQEFDIVEDVETLREEINDVTVDEIVNLNKKIKLSVTYLLKGDN